MNFIEKIRFLHQKKIENLKSNGTYIDIHVRKESLWENGELEKIQAQYHFLSRNYIDFIKEFDDIAVGIIIFNGSKKSSVPIIDEIAFYQDQFHDYYSDDYKFKQYFPFGRYGDGSIWVFDYRGKVFFIDAKDYGWENTKLVSENFSDFMNDCVLGKRYIEFSSKENKFYQYLQSLGWV